MISDWLLLHFRCENRSNTRVGLEEGSPTGSNLWKYTSLAQSVGEEEEAIGRAGDCREVAVILANPDVSQDGSRGGTLKDQHRGQPMLGPQWGKAPCKEFLKGPWRYWLGTVALHEICQYQRSTKLLICKQPFMHLVHKIAQAYGKHDLHLQVHMVQVLEEAAEYYLTGLLEDANLCAIHAKCVTILPDIQLAHCLCREHHCRSVSFSAVVCYVWVTSMGKGGEW